MNTNYLKLEKDLPFNPRDYSSILNHANRLIGKSLVQLVGDDEAKSSYAGKGGFGNKVEEKYFFIQNNSDSSPDFKEVGVELKITPIKSLKKGSFSPKERLVLGKIDYNELNKENDFLKSKFISKNNKILIIFYLYTPSTKDYNYLFKHLITYELLRFDLKIIQDDWIKIRDKVRGGNAHLLSESDTIYLAATTKGKDSSVRTSQPNGPLAKPRAFSFKPSFIKTLLSDFLVKDGQSVLMGVVSKKTFEEIVIDKFNSYIGKSEDELKLLLNMKYSTSAKHKGYLIAKAILGIKKKFITEFEKGGIVVKTITLKETGVIKESMSFKQIKYSEIIDENWEETDFYEVLSSRFFLIVFQLNKSDKPVLKKVKFWNMPEQDLDIVEKVWLDTKKKVKNGAFNDFVKISDNKIAHVRPKAKNNADKMITADGTLQDKKCFWLNASYISEIIK
jgi:DNA mismatch repair protein MutH